MKRILNFCLLLMALIVSNVAHAVIAFPAPAKVTQPDGTVLTVTLHGDEFRHFLTTDDGYTVVRNEAGAYVYANEENGGLVATDIIAHNSVQRTAKEKSFLKGAQRYILPQMTEEQTAMLAERTSALFDAPKSASYDYNKFKGLVILVEYNDCSFSMSNPVSFYNAMINDRHYSGYTTEGDNAKSVECTGSVRDYFYDNSMGRFDPQFDVVGPVKIDYSMYYANSTTYARSLVRAACDAADDMVDFSNYDADGDGTVDMFYLVFAGPGSHVSSNDSRLLWPHASSLSSTTFDGVKLNKYACSTELYGSASLKVIDGIGTICHEFSHVLGLRDEYDTDYASSGGTSAHPGKWSLMAAGSYLNYSRTPAGYSLLQRFQSGFATPEEITSVGEYTLKDIEESNHGYMIRTAEEKEYFLLENRRNGDDSKWNKYVPGHGMLVYRVDSTDVKVWSNNTINADPTHNYYELLRANPSVSGSTVSDSDGDPFPGTGNVTRISSQTSPSLLSWTGLPAMVAIDDIREGDDGVITFSAVKDQIEILIEDFENVTTETSNDTDVEGTFCKWTFTKAKVDAPAASGLCNGARALSMVRGSVAESSAVSGKTKTISFRATNSGSTTVTMNILYYDANSASWKTMVSGSSAAISVDRSTTVVTSVDVPESAATDFRFQIKIISGSSSSKVWVDDIQLVRDNGSQTGINNVVLSAADRTSAVIVSVSGNTATLTCAKDGTAYLCDMAGRRVGECEVIGGTATLQLPSVGCYIVQTPCGAVKIASATRW